MVKKLFQKKVTEEQEPSVDFESLAKEEVQQLPLEVHQVQIAEVPDEPLKLPNTAVTYCKHPVSHRWILVTLKYDPLTGLAKVEELSDENTEKVILRERFIIRNSEMELL